MHVQSVADALNNGRLGDVCPVRDYMKFCSTLDVCVAAVSYTFSCWLSSALHSMTAIVFRALLKIS